MEERELRDLYRDKGFSGPLLDDVVATISADRERWLATILERSVIWSPLEKVRSHAYPS